jgi:Zn finger protein HypA/HybF involved in hydrogenase expression
MPEPAGFKCEQCGHGFMLPVLTERELEELRRERRRGGSAQCPKCGSFNVSRV